MKNGDPVGRKFGGHKYAYWFHADTKAEAEKLKKQFTNPGVSRIRIIKKSRGYDLYGTYVSRYDLTGKLIPRKKRQYPR